MSLNNTPEFYQVTGEINHNAFLIVPTSGVNCISAIFQAFDENNNPVRFQNQRYSIHVSNDAGYEIDPDPYSYYNVMIAPYDERWIPLYSIYLGSDLICSNSFSENNCGNLGSPMHFFYTRFSVAEIPDTKVRITSSSR